MFTTSRLSIGAAFMAVTALAGITAAHRLTTAPATRDVANAKPVAASPTATTPAVASSSASHLASAAAQRTSFGATPSTVDHPSTQPVAAAAVTAPTPTARASSAATVVAHSGPRIANNRPTTAPAQSLRPAAPPKPKPTPTPTPTRVASPSHLPLLGVYAGPDSKGVAGAAAFGSATGRQPQSVLDFAGTDSWANVTAPSWLIAAHSGQSAQFELSLPMLPDGNQYTLAACASGAYDAEWRTTASSLVNHQLASTIVRPGWEFNGNWYHWSAKNNIAGFVGCFQHIVNTMRSTPGQHFRFDWNPDVGANSFPAELAYPGDAYVDYIGVDVYDYSWSRYPAASSGLAAARAAAWNDALNGDHGLAYWSRFAAAHDKPMALPEWAAASRSDGHGGGDNASFINEIFDFMENPANNVAYAHYFNTSSASNDHSLTAGHLPAAAAQYRLRAISIR